MTRLCCISLNPELDHAEAMECSGICSLPLLTHLMFATQNRLSMGSRVLARLGCLATIGDPFWDPLTRATMPALKDMLFCTSSQGLPTWVEDWPLERLEVWSWSALSNARLPYLRCAGLTLVISSAQHLTIDLASILEVPDLRQFTTTRPDDRPGSADTCLQGTKGQYNDLLQHVSFQLGMPTCWKVLGNSNTEVVRACNQMAILLVVRARLAHQFTKA